jgi:hypothetical protein
MGTMGTSLQEKHGIRRYFATQNWLWARHLQALQPWEQDDELRWVRHPVTRRWELRGGVIPGSTSRADWP